MSPRPVSPRIAALDAERQARLRREYETGTLALFIGIEPEQVAEFGDPFAALADLQETTGTMPHQEYRNRLLTMVARQHEMTAEELNAEQKFRKLQQNRRRRERLCSGPRERATPEELHERDGGTCAHCLHPVPRRGSLHWNHPLAPSIDHITPIAKAGTDTLDNKTIAHRFCNADRHNGGCRTTPAQARARLAAKVAEYEAVPRCTEPIEILLAGRRQSLHTVAEVLCSTPLSETGECTNRHRHIGELSVLVDGET